LPHHLRRVSFLQFPAVRFYCRLRHPPHSQPCLACRYDLLRHRRHVCHVSRAHRVPWYRRKPDHNLCVRSTKASQQRRSCITAHLPSSWRACRPPLPSWPVHSDPGRNLLCTGLFSLCPIPRFGIVTRIDFGDPLVHCYRMPVIGEPRQWRCISNWPITHQLLMSLHQCLWLAD